MCWFHVSKYEIDTNKSQVCKIRGSSKHDQFSYEAIRHEISMEANFLYGENKKGNWLLKSQFWKMSGFSQNSEFKSHNSHFFYIS